jgi:hypothetical protein
MPAKIGYGFACFNAEGKLRRATIGGSEAVAIRRFQYVSHSLHSPKVWESHKNKGWTVEYVLIVPKSSQFLADLKEVLDYNHGSRGQLGHNCIHCSGYPDHKPLCIMQAVKRIDEVLNR